MLLRKVKNKLEIILVESLIKAGLRFNYPALSSLGFAIVAGRRDPKKAATVLALGRSIFTHDLKALEELSGQIKYVVIHLRYFYVVYDHFIKGPEKELLTEENYHTKDYCKEGKQKYYLFLKKMFPSLKKLVGFEAAISANFGYTAQQEFARVCEEEKTPFIVVHKEGIATPDAYLDYVSQFKDRKFLGSKILFYNRQIKDAFTKIKINGMTEDKMEIVGIPRLDYCFIGKENKNNEKQVVFFSFFPRDKFTYQIKDEQVLESVKDYSNQFHKSVMDFALAHPEVKVVIMTKLAPHYIEYVRGILDENFKEKIPNLTITNVGDPLTLIKNSIAVIGFHSTTLIESIAVGRLIISPDFKEIIGQQAVDYFKDYPELVNYAKTKGDLEEYIFNQHKYLNYNKEKKDQFLESYIATPDGKACARTEEAILKSITESKKYDKD